MGRRWIGLFGAIAALLFAGGDATASTLVDDYPWPEDLREALDRDDQDAAIGGLRQLVEREREAGVPHLVLGVMLVRREETKEALVHLRKALALLPDLDEEMRLDLEDLVFNQQFLRILEQMDAKTARNDLRGAASVARRARGVEGFGGVARLLEGSIEAQRGRASQAQELFDDSIDAGLPDDMLAYAYFGLGVAACSSGDWGEGLEALDQVGRLDRRFPGRGSAESACESAGLDHDKRVELFNRAMAMWERPSSHVTHVPAPEPGLGIIHGHIRAPDVAQAMFYASADCALTAETVLASSPEIVSQSIDGSGDFSIALRGESGSLYDVSFSVCCVHRQRGVFQTDRAQVSGRVGEVQQRDLRLEGE